MAAVPISLKSTKTVKRNFTDDLGKPTAKWDYFDRNNKLIACVYRYDTLMMEKSSEFWDVRNRKARSPDQDRFTIFRNYHFKNHLSRRRNLLIFNCLPDLHSNNCNVRR